MSKEHWETDQWDEHPVTGTKFGAQIVFHAPTAADIATAQRVQAAGGSNQDIANAVAAEVVAENGLSGPGPKLTWLQKIAMFIVHPIKTLQGNQQSAMHGPRSWNSTLASQDDQPSFFAGSKPQWWESPIGDVRDWER